MKKIPIAIVASGMLFSLSANQTLNLDPNWNLIGTYVNEANLTDVGNNINIAWKWKNNKWEAFSPNSVINELLKKKNIQTFTTVNSGEGFWVNVPSKTSVTFTGEPTNSKLQIAEGWNLLTLTSDQDVSVDYFNNVKTIWKWDSKNQKWAVYSPDANLQSKISMLVKNGTLETFNVLHPGEGFWVYTSSSSSVDLETPPAIGFAYELLDKLNAVPLSNADVYVDGEKVGTTDYNGKFSIDNIANGKAITLKKDGFAVAYGVVKDGKVVILTQKDNNQKVKFSATNGNQKVAKKGITSQDGAVSVIADKMDLKQDITVSVVPFMSPSAAPALNDINVNGTIVPTDQLAIIGGAFVNVEDSNGSLLLPNEINGTVNFSLTQSKILGDLEDILNGDTEDASYQNFSQKAFDQFNNMLNNQMIEILVLQFENGKWEYKGEGKLTEYKKVKKLSNGNTQEYLKYKLETDGELNSLAPTAFVLKMNYLTGEAEICSKEGGFKMFDGSIVDSNDSNSQPFNWINDPIPQVTIIGDDSVVSGAAMTDADGCATIKYKVPFLKPTFNLALKKDGYFDTEISCSVDTNGTKCSDGKMYKIPDTASVEGYVKNKVTGNGIDNALVTLVNLEVLSADKIKTGDDNGTAYVEVGYMPNVTYTWTAVKYDENNQSKKVVEEVIKSGKGDSSYAKLTEKEIYDVLVKPFDDANATFDAKYLTGNWELRVKAEHSFTNTSNTMIEEAVGKFDIDLLMTKLASLMSGQLSEKQEEVVVDENGTQTTLPNSIKSAAIYGGFSLGFLYEYGAQSDSFGWQTAILGDASELTNKSGVVCNDYNDSEAYSCNNDPIADKIDLAYINIAKGDVLEYNKSLYPVAYNVKFMAKHFADLLNKDPESDEGEPFITSGFTLRTLFEGKIDVPTTSNDYNVTYNTYTKYLASYADISGAKSVSDVLDTPKITLVGSSATAYMRQVITKDDNNGKAGYYRINMIPPSLSGDLQIFAKADGYKFNSDSDIKLVNDLEAGKVSNYDLELEPVEINNTNPKVVPDLNITGFNDWNFTNECGVENSKWQVVANPTDINVTNSSWSETVWESNMTLLPDSILSTTGYVWFGDKNTGLFSDTGWNTSSAPVCGKAITPVVDLSNYSFPVLTFKSWFEVESVDVAQGQYDQMKIGFIIPSSDNNGSTSVTIYNTNGDAITVNTDTYYPLDSLNPEYEPSIQDPYIPYSSAGINTLPVWKDYEVSVDGLAGYKVKFVFNFNSVDSLFNGFRGWGIDGVKVQESMDKALSLPPMVPDIDPSITATKKVR